MAPLESFVVNVRKTKLQPGEVLTAVLVPYQPERFGAAYARFALRDGNAIAVAGVAAGLQLDAEGHVMCKTPASFWAPCLRCRCS